MPQRCKYETTTVDPETSAAQIATLVRRYGGSRFEQRWGPDGELDGIRFAIRSDPHGEVPIILEARTERIIDLLSANRQRYRPRDDYLDQANRIAWRQLKDFVEQALFAVETGLFDVASAFMSGLEVEDPENPHRRTTMRELMARHATLVPHREGDLLRLTAGD